MSGTRATLVELEHVLVCRASAAEERACRSGSPRSTSSSRAACASGRRRWAGASWPARPSPTPTPTFADAWKACVEMGVATIGLPESYGGGGGSVLDQAVALEACAHELVPGPLLVDRGGRAGGAVERARRRRRGGASRSAPGLAGDLRRGHPPARRRRLLVAARRRAVPALGIDLTRRFGAGRGRVDAAGAATDLVRRTTRHAGGRRGRGVARWCLETAVDYAKVREQFGQKIGAFQAVKHLCAEMLETAEAVTAAAWDVASAAAGRRTDDDQWAYAADVAEVTCFDGAVEVAKSCIQVLGGIGFTYEHDAHLYLRRALALRGLVGDADAAALRLTDARGRRRTPPGRGRPRRPRRRRPRRRSATTPTRIGGAARASERRAALVEAGYLTPHWPAPYGLGADAVTQLVIDEELARAGVARPDIVIAGWALPTILEHGTDAQRERFVLPSLRGEMVWCQLFSEPGLGLRPRVAAHPGRAGRRRLAADRPEGVDLGAPSAPTGGSAWPAPTPTCRSTRASPTSWST